MSTVFAGAQVGKYVILDQLGGGGMGNVFKARNKQTNETVALKLIFVSNAESREIADAEEGGAQLQKVLSQRDRRVAAVEDIAEDNGYFYVAMEYVEGDDLSSLIQRGPLSMELALGVAFHMCELMEKAHGFDGKVKGVRKKGIIHGDVKPGNIRVTGDGSIKFLDFGIAKALSEFGKSTSNDFLSRAYSSPERLETGKMDALSDLWSVGVVLYEMIFGVRPFVAATNETLERLIRSRQLIWFPDHPEIPAALERVLLKALAPKESMRYVSAKAFKEDLKALQQGRKTSAEYDSISEYEIEQLRTERTQGSGSGSKAGNDPEATFKTRPLVDSTPTTIKLDPPVDPNLPERVAKKPRPIYRRILLFIAGVVVLIGLFNEGVFYSQAAALRDEVESMQLRDCDKAWLRYKDLPSWNLTRLFFNPASQPVRKLLIAEADRVFADFRSEKSTVDKDDWGRAKSYLAHVLEIDSADNVARSMHACASGQIHRINGTPQGNSSNQKVIDTQKEHINHAIVEFQNSMNLDPRLVDPHLGMAAVYSYGRHDPDATSAEVEAARRLGFKTGKRWTAMVADAHRNRGRALEVNANAITDPSQKKEILLKARGDYESSKTLYNSILPFEKANENIELAEKWIKGIDKKVEAIDAEEASSEFWGDGDTE